MDNEDTFTVVVGTDTLTFDNSTLEIVDLNNVGSITIDSSFDPNDHFTFDDDAINIFRLHDPVEFEDCMPSLSKVEDMCKEYPALEKAFNSFKNIYSIVHQDWVGRNNTNDELPF